MRVVCVFGEAAIVGVHADAVMFFFCGIVHTEGLLGREPENATMRKNEICP